MATGPPTEVAISAEDSLPLTYRQRSHAVTWAGAVRRRDARPCRGNGRLHYMWTVLRPVCARCTAAHGQARPRELPVGASTDPPGYPEFSVCNSPEGSGRDPGFHRTRYILTLMAGRGTLVPDEGPSRRECEDYVRAVH
jgi:hypothetical protein